MEGYGNENPGAFQSTRPLRGATVAAKRTAHERPISTHVPLAGRDRLQETIFDLKMEFQPTRPLRGATSCRSFPPIPYKAFQPTRPLRGATGWGV